MAAETGLTTKLSKAIEVEFVNKFGLQVGALIELLNVRRKVEMPLGATIKTYKSSVTLAEGKVAKGDIIPLSEVKKEVADTFELEWNKFRKAVAIEDIQMYGAKQALMNTDEALLKEVQKGIRKKLIDNLAKGTGKAEGVGLQAALAQGWGAVQTVFEDDAVQTIAFANPQDIADYLAKANISIQTAFGLSYVENFMGASVVVISPLVPAKTIYATAPENLVIAYAPMNGEAGSTFDFYSDDTGLVGITHDTAKERLQAETILANAMVLFAERLDGVVVVTIRDAVEA